MLRITRRLKARSLAMLLLAVVSLSWEATAQTEAGQIGGRVLSPQGAAISRGDGDGEVGWHGSRAHRDNEFHGSVYEFNHANLYVRGGEADVSSFSYVPAFRDGRRNVQLALKLNF